MSELIDFGPTPAYEDCAQVGAPDYEERSRAECAVWARQLYRAFPEARDTLYLFTKCHPHDFGTYREVVTRARTEEQAELAYRIQDEAPTQWDAEARAELGLPPA